MAGKSTVLRSVAAAALCGCVGLGVPAGPGSLLPQLDAVVLRTFSGDAPQEGLSAFGVEMKEMTYVINEARPHSLVLVDELGKGTEAVWGTALTAALLQQLAATGASGIFATHLHLLLPLLEGVPRLHPYKMAVREAPPPPPQQQQQRGGLPRRLEATMRLEPGACTESLALEVAEQQGMPLQVLQQAVAHFQALRDMAASRKLGANQLLVQAAASSTRWSSSSSDDEESGLALSSSDGSEASPKQQDEQQQQPAASRRRQRRAGGSAATEQQEPSAVAVEAQQSQQQQRVCTLLAQLALQLPLAADAAQPEPQPWPEGVQAAAAVPLRGVVHHLAPEQQPPPSHETGSWVYVVRHSGDSFYVGESQVLRRRRRQHMSARSKQLDMWYVALGPEQDRRAAQALLIQALDTAGLRLDSRHDAHFARKK